MRKLAIVALVGIAGCITPSIPIPPPDPSEMSFHLTVDGQVSRAVFNYPATSAYKHSTVYLLNQASGHGVFQIANADGSIGPTDPLDAKLGDQVVVTIQTAAESVSTCVVLREGQQDPTNYCQ